MPAAQCQRSQFAEGLSLDQDSGQLVPVQKHVSSFASSIQSIDDGVVFLSKDTSRNGGYAPSHRCMAAVPSQLAERMAGIARTAKAAGENDHAVRERLSRWNTYGVLFNIILEEEYQLRSSLGLARIVPTNEILLGNISKMPKIFKNWNPMNTSVSIESTGTTVMFSDYSNNPLIRVWVSHDGDHTNGPARSSPDTPKTPANPQTMVAIKVVRSLYGNSPSCIDSKAYDFSTVCNIPGGVKMRMNMNGFAYEHMPLIADMMVAVPSDLAQRVKAVAFHAAKSGAKKDHTKPADRVKAAVQEFMADWVDGGVLLDLTSQEESELRRRYKIADEQTVSRVFQHEPRLLPKVYKNWDPSATTVEPNTTQGHVVVTFKAHGGQNIIGVWLKP